jgi:hypothetical protein
MPAFTTKFVSWKILRVTLRTDLYEFFSAFTAKFAGLRIFRLAVWAFHCGCPPDLKRGGFLRKKDGNLVLVREEYRPDVT